MSKKIILFLGPPGSNKTKAAQILQLSFGYDFISWGEILNKTRKYRTGGEELFTRMLQKSQSKNDKVFIIDGYPVHISEAEKMIDFTRKNDFEIEAIIRFNNSMERSVSRRQNIKICPLCCREYLKSDSICLIDETELTEKYGPISIRTMEMEYNYLISCIDATEKYLKNFCPVSFSIDANAGMQSIVGEILNGIHCKKSNDSRIYKQVASTILETDYGPFKLIAYQSSVDYSYHLAMVKGNVKNKNNVLTRVHSSCITGDILHSRHCDCGQQLQKALKLISEKGAGVVMYLFQEGRGINIINKIKAYQLQSKGMDTIEANIALGMPSEMRDYAVVKDIVDDLKINSVALLTNNPDKITKLKSHGVVVESMKNHEVQPSQTSLRYLKTKKEKMAHKMRRV